MTQNQETLIRLSRGLRMTAYILVTGIIAGLYARQKHAPIEECLTTGLIAGLTTLVPHLSSSPFQPIALQKPEGDKQGDE